MKNFMAALMIVALFATPAFANVSIVDQGVNEIVNLYIDMDESKTGSFSNDKDFTSNMDSYISSCESFVDVIIEDEAMLEEFKNTYAGLEAPFRPMLDPVVEMILEASAARGLGETPENYPGYGYPDPDYKYRRGKELSREALSVFWQKEKKTVEESQTIKTSMELSVAAGWGQDNTANGNIDNFQIGQTSKINVNGSMKTVCEVTFTTRMTMETNCTVKYQKSKVWHELWRAKKKWFGLSTGDWMVCGKTYEVIQEETGLEVIEESPTFKPNGSSSNNNNSSNNNSSTPTPFTSASTDNTSTAPTAGPGGSSEFPTAGPKK